MLFGEGVWWERQFHVIKPETPLLPFMNVRYLVSLGGADVPRLEAAGWRPVESADRIDTFKSEATFPRYFLVGRVHAANGVSSRG